MTIVIFWIGLALLAVLGIVVAFCMVWGIIMDSINKEENAE